MATKREDKRVTVADVRLDDDQSDMNNLNAPQSASDRRRQSRHHHHHRYHAGHGELPAEHEELPPPYPVFVHSTGLANVGGSVMGPGSGEDSVMVPIDTNQGSPRVQLVVHLVDPHSTRAVAAPMQRGAPYVSILSFYSRVE